jgi:enamine deaminase RidA (YjgF/YER057c/UK114 family)
MSGIGSFATFAASPFTEKSMSRKNISTGSKWEPIIGYSRAVRVGNQVFVSGTTGTDANGQVAGDAYAQSKQALANIASALAQAGVSIENVVRTRIFMTDITQWEAAGKAHGEVFGSIRPATTMVQVAKLIDPAMLVEIEADAVVA